MHTKTVLLTTFSLIKQTVILKAHPTNLYLTKNFDVPCYVSIWQNMIYKQNRRLIYKQKL